MLGFQNIVIEDQFLRGLSPDNMLEVDRIGADRALGEIVDALEKIEKRKAEMRLGLTNRSTQQEIISRTITPVQVPPVSAQEPVITKPVTAQEITHEQMNQLLKAQADNLTNNFQAQIQALQDKISQQSQPAFKPSRRHHEECEANNPFDDDYDRTWSFEEIMGKDYKQLPKPNKMLKEFAIYKQAIAKAKKAKYDQEVDNLAERLAGIKITDNYDSMGTSNLIDGGRIIEDENGNEFIIHAIRSVKKK